MSANPQPHHNHFAAHSTRDLLRVQATLESSRQRPSHAGERPAAARPTPTHPSAPAHAHAIGDACMYVCQCGLKFTASTCPHTACPACGREQPW